MLAAFISTISISNTESSQFSAHFSPVKNTSWSTIISPSLEVYYLESKKRICMYFVLLTTALDPALQFTLPYYSKVVGQSQVFLVCVHRSNCRGHGGEGEMATQQWETPELPAEGFHNGNTFLSWFAFWLCCKTLGQSLFAYSFGRI